MSFDWNGKFRVCGMERSGSTFVWQVLRELGCDVVKSHSYDAQDALSVKLYTYRDPRDVICSYARTVLAPEVKRGELSDINSITGMSGELLRVAAYRLFYRPNARQLDYRCYVWEANQGAPICFIKYEDYFNGNEATLVGGISHFVSQFQEVKMDANLFNMIAKKYSKDKNAKRASAFDSFDEWDNETQIHGNHITNGGSTWRDDFNWGVAVCVDKHLGDFLIELEYEKDRSWILDFMPKNDLYSEQMIDMINNKGS
jgi:hypothetical protein